MDAFDLLGPLPEPATTTVLEASAGTGKTYALAGLVTRYLAEGAATLDQMLLITFSRAATRELRERVRAQLVKTAAALDDPPADADDLIRYLANAAPAELAQRRDRLRNALSEFDAATIATTHEFCGLVLRSLGIAGDTDSGAQLVESLDDLVAEIVSDLYLTTYGDQRDEPALSYADALDLAKRVVGDPSAQLRPRTADPDSVAAQRLSFATAVQGELERRKRRLGVLSFDDLLSRLATALEEADAPARDRMRRRWPIVMVDEFQDTDPVQWQVISRAFVGHSAVVLIGDPKQAIYAFRGGDIVTYLDAARSADQRLTLAENWRSDKVLVDRLQTVLKGAALGDEDIVVHPIEAHTEHHRLAGAPRNDPFRLRVVPRTDFGTPQRRTIPIGPLRTYIAKDLAADISVLLASGATFNGRPLTAGDIAVIVDGARDAEPCRDALLDLGIPVVYSGDTDVFASAAAAEWLRLLDAFDTPNRSGVVRAASTTMFFGYGAAELAAGGDELTDQIATTIRQWAGLARDRGIAAVFEAAQGLGLSERVLGHRGGERRMTDLAHVGQLLHETAHRERYHLPALRDWLRRQLQDRGGPAERNRRLDSDAAAVQIMTVWRSKGLQFPVVYLPFGFNRNVQTDKVLRFHDADGTRCLHVGGAGAADRTAAEEAGLAEIAGDNVRLTYVALTRAQSQVVAWWAPSWDEKNGGLSRLLRGRQAGAPAVPDVVAPQTISDDDAMACFTAWEQAGGPVIETAEPVAPAPQAVQSPPRDLDVRHFHRSIDTHWRRTSYSALVRIVHDDGHAVSSEPDSALRDDESDVITEAPPGPLAGDLPSPMAQLPAGAAFGSLVHAVLELADPLAADLTAELAARIDEQTGLWDVEVPTDELAAAMVPMHDTPLGPLAPGLTLRQIGLKDRLRELDFEMPLGGGQDRSAAALDIRLGDVGALVAELLPASDPLSAYGTRLQAQPLGHQRLHGYLSGSIDAVLRVPAGDDHRYLVVDYKTNRLGDFGAENTAADYTAPLLAEAMMHSDYPLQALLYSVVLHRFLRWRLPGYVPERHLGGVAYLFVRGMCGPETPVVEGNPCGVFSWQPPVELVSRLSDLLDRGTQS
ncbi:AAA family ATPase [Mycobacterium sp. CBMA293]|uniref:UvrD-helicase domain-containing protein n=1 Tax=unclassified Mycolicibacterium TaxID=2636767 RepID=UPI0012DF5501|nr:MULTISPECIES: UvrD-helicase domain-containing protein [unclassified Mycolicibacterium]MUL44715.1 AAA family ATPase [Mycolicibacterium sp. CBMA 360]MUL60039.1 AAA family ATPase [Mycolicibacterium sp. CBMA 335]MUL68882.1 AAA family ATPase [Mycolicibacterium sp. CBMA 311]MUL93727.1 AAA family ATPase [Mycolicibacterium sp. CBMA 230]MUM05970.1 exodeoxyribonuclease V subunit beta [Mycolicibacterium sp. CBMA 213]